MPEREASAPGSSSSGIGPVWVMVLLLFFSLLAAAAGFIAGYSLEYWTAVIAYPLNIGVRPYHACPMFVPPAFVRLPGERVAS